MSSCSNIINPQVLNSMTSIGNKKQEIAFLGNNLVSGKKDINTASVVELSTARAAENKSAAFASGIKNIERGNNILAVALEYLNDASCHISDMKDAAVDASSAAPEELEQKHVPLFETLVNNFKKATESYVYDGTPILNGGYTYTASLGNACGQGRDININLINHNATMPGLGLADKESHIAAITNIKLELASTKESFEELHDKIGNEAELGAQLSDVQEKLVSTLEKIEELQGNIEEATPDEALETHGAKSDGHIYTITDLQTAVSKLNQAFQDHAWDVNTPNAGSNDGTVMKAQVEGHLSTLAAIVASEFKATETAFANSQLKVSVAIPNDVKKSITLLTKAQDKLEQDITKLEGYMNANNRMKCLLEKNMLIANKVAHDYGAVDPIETNTAIAKNKLELERAVCTLKESQNMEYAFSKYLSQCADYCA